MGSHLTLTTFTPAEAERLTGLSTTMQRDWRRRGYLPSGEGHARFDVFALAEMWALKLLADRGIGPQTAKDVAPWCSAGIVWQALRWIDSYEGDHDRTFEWYPPDARPRLEADPALVAAFELAKQEHPEVEVPADNTWCLKADWLAKQIFRLRGQSRVIPAPFFFWWADGTHLFHTSLVEAFGGLSSDPRYAGPVVVLDLTALGSALGERAGRAFVHVEYEVDAETGTLKSPLQYGATVPLS